jgi:hypothetical protein
MHVQALPEAAANCKQSYGWHLRSLDLLRCMILDTLPHCGLAPSARPRRPARLYVTAEPANAPAAPDSTRSP